MTGNKKCVENIAEANVLQYVLLVLYMLPSCESCDCHVTKHVPLDYVWLQLDDK